MRHRRGTAIDRTVFDTRWFRLRSAEAVATGNPDQQCRQSTLNRRIRLDYKIPDTYVLQLPGPPVVTPAPPATAAARSGAGGELPPPVPTWVEAWSDARADVVILAVLLSVLTLIFIFQATLARHRVAHRARAHRILAGCSTVARLDGWRAALDRQRRELCAGAVQSRRHGVST
jgi:hypothetical protein